MAPRIGEDDEGGKVEVVVFPEAYSRCGGLIADDALLLVRGKYERDEDTGSLKAEELVPLEVVRESSSIRARARSVPIARLFALDQVGGHHRCGRQLLLGW